MTKKIRFYILVFSINAVCIPLYAQDLVAVKTPEGIEISEGPAKVLFYQTKTKSLDGKYARSNYIHPLYSLDGNILTEDFPADHPHHHGVFWAWHQIFQQNKLIADGWLSENIAWENTKAKTSRRKNALVLTADVLWKSAVDGNRSKAIVSEDTRITVHPAKENYRIIDFDIKLTALIDSLKMGGSADAKGYGGFSCRFKLPGDIAFVNAHGEVVPDLLAVNAGPWLDFSGSFDGAKKLESGVAIFCHPENPGHPQPWILRRERSMQNIAFPGQHAVLFPRKGFRLQYRMVIHNNKVDRSAIDKLYREYTDI